MANLSLNWFTLSLLVQLYSILISLSQIQQLEASDSDFDHDAVSLLKSYTDEAKKSKDSTHSTLAELLKANASHDVPLHSDLPEGLIRT